MPEADKGMSYYKGRPDEQPMYMKYFGHGHHFKDKRPNMEIKPGRDVGGGKPASRHGALRGRASATARRPRAAGARPRLLRTCQHQHLPEPFDSRKPLPGVRAALGQRNQRGLVRHRRGRRGRRLGRRTASASMRCACARRRASRISARSTTLPISRRSSAGSAPSRTSGSTCIAAWTFPGRTVDLRRRRQEGAGDR